MNDRFEASATAYQARLAKEERFYENCESVHDLPGIFHYWSNRHIRPKLEALGFSSPNGMFRKFIEEQTPYGGNDPKRFASIGSGNCDLEIDLALHLRTKGRRNFVIHCFDLNPAMLERGRAAAVKNDVAEQMHFVQTDLNEWEPATEYDAVIANQTLHHVLRLEDLFAQVKHCLKSGGCFIVSDMIGRNGHQRWPEALEIVQEFWRKLPPSYRFNRLLERYEERFEDWDCSGESFEGIRSQDILPLLLESFHFQLFIGFANVIDPFVDRMFGSNFDANAPWDRQFIDQVHERDEKEMVSGRIKPTHMLAVLRHERGPAMCHEPLTPEFSVRRPATIESTSPIVDEDPYEWHTWPHSSQNELKIACRGLSAIGHKARQEELRLNGEIRDLNTHAFQLGQQLEVRTTWALQLNKELNETTELAQRLEQQFQERTEWALQLDRELAQRTEHAALLNEQLERRNQEVEERTAWAQRLDRELEDSRSLAQRLSRDLEQVAWARALDRHFHHFFDRAYRLVRQVRDRFSSRTKSRSRA